MSEPPEPCQAIWVECLVSKGNCGQNLFLPYPKYTEPTRCLMCKKKGCIDFWEYEEIDQVTQKLVSITVSTYKLGIQAIGLKLI
jgi:hypothetical protein